MEWVVPTIGSQLADVWVAFGHPCQQERRPIPIADVCGVGLECQHQPLSIDQQVTFAAIDLLATIKATLRIADIGCFDRLAVPRIVVLIAIEPPQSKHSADQQARAALPVIERQRQFEQREGELLKLALDLIGYCEADVASFIGERWLAILPMIDAVKIDTYRQRITCDVQVFLKADLSPSLAAERLHIHRHTLAHRLDKVARLTGLDPRRFHELAQLHAALVLRRMCDEPT
jgi:hypothetical protein